MNRILGAIKKKGVFEFRLKKYLIEDAIAKFILKEYYIEIENNVIREEEKDNLYDSISLYKNDWNDIAIEFNKPMGDLEERLRADHLITEDDCFRATNLCIKAIAAELDCDKNKVDIWPTEDLDYVRIQLPIDVININ